MKFLIWSDYYPIPSPSARENNSASALIVLLRWMQKPADSNMYGNVVSFSRQSSVCSGSEATFRGNKSSCATVFRAHEIVNQMCGPYKLGFIVVARKVGKMENGVTIVTLQRSSVSDRVVL
jgi:hypothetical protein